MIYLEHFLQSIVQKPDFEEWNEEEGEREKLE